MCKGMVFNIQKFSIHDGPGIRTTVFLKGCPLRCRWCSNPESQLSKTQILYDASVCIQDGACIKACPQQAVQRKGSRIVIDDAQCLGCLRCIATCKAKALQVEGVCRDADEVSQPACRTATFMKNLRVVLHFPAEKLWHSRHLQRHLFYA